MGLQEPPQMASDALASSLVLEGLDDVAWSKLDHAFGPADDVPDLLRALASADEASRARAQFELYGTLWHQGTVYQATQRAIPYLVESLESAEHVDRPWVLVYLAALAHGNSHHEVHQDIGLYQQERDTPEFHAKIHRELLWVAEAHHAVRIGAPTYHRMLEHEDPDTRAAAAYLLGDLRQDAPVTIPLLARRLEHEEHVVARASLVEALGNLGDEPLTRVRLAKLVETDPSPYVRWAAARSLAFLAGEDSPPSVAQTLLESLRDPSLLEAAHAESPWAEENTPAASARALLALGPDNAAPALASLVEVLAEADPSSGLAICETLLGLSFRPGECNEASFDSLSSAQQEILRTIAYSESAWAMGASMGVLLARYKLPRDDKSLQAYAGLAPRDVGGGDTGLFGGPGESMAGAPIPTDLL